MEDHTVFRSFSDKKSPRKSFRLKPPFTRHAISILICVACMLCATLASFLYQHIVPDNHANVALFYILALVIIARWTVGYGYGIACTLFSVIAINYLFTYPYYKLNFTLTGYPITFLLMSGITLILCTMTSHMTIQSEMIAEREKRLAEAEMEKMRANLLRAISHDLRTPLTGIIGNSSLFLESQNDLSSTEQRTIMTNIYDDSSWLVNIVENLLSVTRIQGDSLSIKYHRGTGGGSGGRSFGKAEKALSRCRHPGQDPRGISDDPHGCGADRASHHQSAGKRHRSFRKHPAH